MQKLDFNRGWTCKCLTRNEEAYPVTLPHDAMLSEPRTEESPGEEIQAGTLAEIMSTGNNLQCPKNIKIKRFCWNLKVFIIMQRYISMKKKGSVPALWVYEFLCGHKGLPEIRRGKMKSA